MIILSSKFTTAGATCCGVPVNSMPKDHLPKDGMENCMGKCLKQDVYLWKISAQFKDGEYGTGIIPEIMTTCLRQKLAR